MPVQDTEALTVALEAKSIAEDALAKANTAITVANRAESSVAGLAHEMKRCTGEMADMRAQLATDHQETLSAIAGAASTDTKQAAAIEDTRKSLGEATAKLEADAKAAQEAVTAARAVDDAKHAADMAALEAKVTEAKKDLAAVKGDISSTALMKIAGAVAGTIGVIGAAVAGLIVALTPVAPKILEARYAQPVVLVQPAPSATPAPSVTPAPPAPTVSR